MATLHIDSEIERKIIEGKIKKNGKVTGYVSSGGPGTVSRFNKMAGSVQKITPSKDGRSYVVEVKIDDVEKKIGKLSRKDFEMQGHNLRAKGTIGRTRIYK